MLWLSPYLFHPNPMFRIARILALLTSAMSSLSASAPPLRVFVGTYTANGSRGIYSVRLDSATGALTTPVLAAETPDPAWITLSPDKKFLYAIHPSAPLAAGFAVNPASAQLTPLPAAPAAAAQPPATSLRSPLRSAHPNLI